MSSEGQDDLLLLRFSGGGLLSVLNPLDMYEMKVEMGSLGISVWSRIPRMVKLVERLPKLQNFARVKICTGYCLISLVF